jgi:serine/threonine protein kinase
MKRAYWQSTIDIIQNMLTPDTVLQNRYRIVRQLGQGGMGAVYEAVDERLDSTVALKETFFADERLRKQFEREARLLARLHHPALPRVSDHFSEGEGQFLVMHFIAGDDLGEMSARRGGALPPEEVLTWTDQLLDALDYLHTQDPQIIHRDIKPQNLKLTPRGQIILLDFGLAKGQAGEISRVTTTGSIFGYTPNYAPLEQIQGLGTDARSDLYALAATMYHMMTGVKPPDALTRAAAIVNGQPDPLKPAHELNPNVPPQSALVLHAAMAQNRDQRYASAAEMRNALQAARSETTVSNRTDANTIIVPVLAPVASRTTADVHQTTDATGETTVVHLPDKPHRSSWAIAAAAVILVGAVGTFYAYRNRNNSANVETPSIEQSATPVVENEATGGGTAAPVQTPAPRQVTADKPQAPQENTARKQERSTRQSVAERQQADRAAAEEANRARAERQSREQRSEPETSDDFDDGGSRRQRTRPQEGEVIRTLPDGSQIIIGRNGNRILVAPDGSRQVIRRGERINRRRLPRWP